MDITDIEEFNVSEFSKQQLKQVAIVRRKAQFVRYITRKTFTNVGQFNKVFKQSIKMFHITIGKSELYNIAEMSGLLNDHLRRFCVAQSSRSHSGVCVIATIMAPAYEFVDENGSETKVNFTCKYDCAFCPNDPQQARSYPRAEPVPKRGQQNEFCVVRQAHSRCHTLRANHHVVDKLEWLILGGTWSSFPKSYRTFYHTSLLYAANLWAEGINVCEIQDGLCESKPKSKPKSSWISRLTDTWYEFASDMMGLDSIDSNSTSTSTPPDAWRQHVRPMGTFAEEAEINRASTCRVIGITVETRPDEITLQELRFMRGLGVTRIQMGFQHTNNEVLKKNTRGCSIEQCIRGLKLAMINGFKVDGHWMPDLPGSSVELDYEMITRAFTDSDLRCDQVKLYPCQVLDFTKIKEWYDAKTYVPWAELNFEAMLNLIIYAKSLMQPWVRTNRVVRDFPKKIIKGGLQITHLNDLVLREMKNRGINCMCIRCREVKRQIVDYDEAKMHVRKYEGCGGDEYFISMEIGSDPGILLGFCRLRINPRNIDLRQQFDELHGHALIRELHVYGNTTKSNSNNTFTQHRGFGKRLMIEAERIARATGHSHISVISGIGVQNYYNARGYEDGLYMTKELY